jgi:predicted phage terminase large subunit-like protein
MNKADALMMIRLKEEELIRNARKGKLLSFTKFTMPEYEISWHHQRTARVLNDFIARKIRRLMIFEPPRHGKSELTSRRLPALLHGLYPNDEILAGSYNSELAGDMTIDCQRIMDTARYKEIFPTVGITADGSKGQYARNRNEHEIIPYRHPDKRYTIYKGSYRSAGVGGSFTGRGANWILLDDLVKNREDADSVQFREKVWRWYTSTIRTRLEGEGSICLTMTRWHDDDLAGRLLKLQKADPDADQWYVLELPALKVDNRDPEDTREIGTPLWPTKFSAQALQQIKASVGSREWSALYQQSPVSEGGNIIKSDWMRYYMKLPERFDEVVQSWDFATKDKDSSAYTVGQVWGRVRQQKYLLDQVRGRWSFPDACNEVVKLSKKHPYSHRKLVEAKANGPAVVQTLKKYVNGLVEVEPRGDKIARLNAVSPDFESGNVELPHSSIAPWISDYVMELISVPAAAHWDQADTTSQALDYLRKSGPSMAPIAGHGGY